MSIAKKLFLCCDDCGEETDFDLPQPTSPALLLGFARRMGWKRSVPRRDPMDRCSMCVDALQEAAK